jgi:hypothetical protein
MGIFIELKERFAPNFYRGKVDRPSMHVHALDRTVDAGVRDSAREQQTQTQYLAPPTQTPSPLLMVIWPSFGL